ncbi:MAG TPA: ATP-binding protein, partial [Acinetobacter nosocomialis]|nr:ATP-binding protein [Acinetobacter nosocomialis]
PHIDTLPPDTELTTAQIDNLYQQIQNLNEQQKNELLRMIHAGDTSEETSSL